MAAQELLPSEPSDLTALLTDSAKRAALVARDARGQSDPLLAYLCEGLEDSRIAFWNAKAERLLVDGVVPLVAGDPGYPTYRPGYWNAPPIFFSRGELPPPCTSSLAIIGSRDTDALTLKETRLIAAEIADQGVTVVSGLAAGVDTSAHLGALDVNGVTVAVLGTGIDNVYPLQNEMLAHDITRNGAVISQFAPDAPRTPTSFLRRNNVIAGVSDGSLVMAADQQSGSRHEVTQAASYGRPVLLWARTLSDEPWARDLVVSGYGTFVETPGEILETLRNTYAN